MIAMGKAVCYDSWAVLPSCFPHAASDPFLIVC